MRLNMRPGTVGAAAVIVIVGFAIGAWLAINTRAPQQQTKHVTVATHTVAAPATRTAAPPPARTLAPAATPSAPPATVMPTAAPTAAVPSSSTPLQGAWQLDEANIQVGAIVWTGAAVLAPGNTMVLDVRKQSVRGRAAVPCERHTALHAAFAIGVVRQTVPFREVNCNGLASSGDVHITHFSGDGRSFSGSFSQDGANLGTFTARKL